METILNHLIAVELGQTKSDSTGDTNTSTRRPAIGRPDAHDQLHCTKKQKGHSGTPHSLSLSPEQSDISSNLSDKSVTYQNCEGHGIYGECNNDVNRIVDKVIPTPNEGEQRRVVRSEVNARKKVMDIKIMRVRDDLNNVVHYLDNPFTKEFGSICHPPQLHFVRFAYETRTYASAHFLVSCLFRQHLCFADTSIFYCCY